MHVKRIPPDCCNVSFRQDWISARPVNATLIQHSSKTPHSTTFFSAIHLATNLPQTTSQNLIHYFRNVTLRLLHSQNPNFWVTYNIAYWNTVALGKPGGRHFSMSFGSFPSTFSFGPSRSYALISPSPSLLHPQDRTFRQLFSPSNVSRPSTYALYRGTASR